MNSLIDGVSHCNDVRPPKGACSRVWVGHLGLGLALVLLATPQLALAAGDVMRDCDYAYEDVVEAQSDQGYPLRTIEDAKLVQFKSYLDRVTGDRYQQLLAASVVQREDGPSAIVWTSEGCVEQITLPGSIHRLKGWD